MLKSPQGSPFYILLNIYPSINFLNTVQIFYAISELYCVLLRRKWTFENIALYPNYDVIFKVNCVLLRRMPRCERKRFHVAQHTISELLKRFRSMKGSLLVFQHFFVNFSFKKVLSIILKLCAIRALSIAPTLDLPVLLLFSAHISYGKGKYLNQTGFFFFFFLQNLPRFYLYLNLRVLPIEFNPHKFSFVRYVFVEIFEVFLKNDENDENDPLMTK